MATKLEEGGGLSPYWPGHYKKQIHERTEGGICKWQFKKFISLSHTHTFFNTLSYNLSLTIYHTFSVSISGLVCKKVRERASLSLIHLGLLPHNLNDAFDVNKCLQQFKSPGLSTRAHHILNITTVIYIVLDIPWPTFITACLLRMQMSSNRKNKHYTQQGAKIKVILLIFLFFVF